MTKLERHIKATALMTIRRIGKITEDFPTSIALFPFMCDGVYDDLVYDVSDKRFTKIVYYKCGFSDETEAIEIKL